MGNLKGFFKKRQGMRGTGQKGDQRRVLRTKTLNVLTVERSYQFSIQIEHLHAKVPLLKLTGKIRIFGRICPHRPTLYDLVRTFF